MHRVTGATWRALGIGLVAVFVVAGFVLGAVPFAPHAASGHSSGAAAAPAVKASPTPLARAPYVPIVSVGINNNLPPNLLAYYGYLTPPTYTGPTFTFTALPLNVSFFVNISYAPVDNTHTDLTVTLAYAISGAPFAQPIYLTGDVNLAKVHTWVNNGVPYSYYLWNFTLGKATLHCASVSCTGTVPANGTPIDLTVNATEAAGSTTAYSWSSAYGTAMVTTAFVGTFAQGSITAPAIDPNPYDSAYGTAFTPVGTTVSFTTNISWGWTNNDTDTVLQLYDFSTFSYLGNISFNGTVNTTGKDTAGAYVSSMVTFNYTLGAAHVPYSRATWTVTLNETNLIAAGIACTNPACSNIFTTPQYVYLLVNVTENGAPAGGGSSGSYIVSDDLQPYFNPVTLVFQVWGYEPTTFGSTIYDIGLTNAPVPYTGLPFTLTGVVTVAWTAANLSTLAPAAATKTSPGNLTFAGGWLDLNYTNNSVTDGSFAGKLLDSLSISNSVNTTNAYGVSFVPVLSQMYTTSVAHPSVITVPFNSTTYDFSITLNVSNSGWTSSTVQYLPTNLTGYLPFNGNASKATWGVFNPIPPGLVDSWSYIVLSQYPTSVAVKITPILPGYVPYGYAQNFTITVTNAQVDPTTTTIFVAITDLTIGVEGASLGIGPDFLTSTPVTVVPGQTTYTFTFSATDFACTTLVCLTYESYGLIPGPTDTYAMQVFVYVDGIGTPVGPGATNGTYATAFASSSFLSLAIPLSANLASPNPSAVITPGNVTVSVAFSGSFISAVALDIYSPTGALVFAQSFSTSGTNATWIVTSPGTYKASVVVTTAYTPITHYFNATLTVSKVPRIYVNATSYSNATLISGLSSAGAGTLLLVLGLIIGMIVAFILGRAVFGGRAQPAPPQAWEGKPGGQPSGPGAGANVCSVCGKSFATPEELAAHGKSEHGME